MFATVFLASLEPYSGQLVYVNAGHEPALIIAPDGGIEELRPTGPALGMLPDSRFTAVTRNLERGHSLFAFTDGLVEAHSPTGEVYMATATFASAELFYLGPHIIFGTAGESGAFTNEQLNTLALMSLRLYGYGGMAFTVFYGLSWILRGYLIFKSGFIPKTLGVLMTIGGMGFALRNFLLLLAPSFASNLLLVSLMPGTLLLVAWLLVKGVDVSRWDARAAVTR